ncbi:unnamed protein product [Cuscuta epithymum]|uniref:Uncharacterized protein n=1 Tax=Cuscuta epithymum TaxID=186058 RepID=A0AAV0FJ02_9ASTE|nr:unnamed protein product [Cuscuta epithymum]
MSLQIKGTEIMVNGCRLCTTPLLNCNATNVKYFKLHFLKAMIKVKVDDNIN